MNGRRKLSEREIGCKRRKSGRYCVREILDKKQTESEKKVGRERNWMGKKAKV